MRRWDVGVRLAVLLALNILRCSSLDWALYILLPALAALALTRQSAARYIRETAPRLVRILRWLAQAYAYLWLLTDALPGDPESDVDLSIDPSGTPTVPGALLRLLSSLPALLILAVMSVCAGLLWPVTAAFVLIRGRAPGRVPRFIAATLQYHFWLVAYHLSIVDTYPMLHGGATHPWSSESSTV